MTKTDEKSSANCCSTLNNVSITIEKEEVEEIEEEDEKEQKEEGQLEDCIDIQLKEEISIIDDNEAMTVKFEKECGKCEIDGIPNYKQNFASNKNIAEGMMDIALLTANANQLRFLITYNSTSQTYYISLILIIISLVLQVTVGIGLIFKRKIKKSGKRNKMSRTNDLLVGGIFMITVVNVFVASFTTTDTTA